MPSQKQGQKAQIKQNITLDRGAKTRTIIQIGALNLDISKRLLIGALLALLLQSGIVLTGYQRIIGRLPNTPKGEMTGTFNIAVVPFGQWDEINNDVIASVKGLRLAEQSYRVVEENFKLSGLDYDKRAPGDVNILTDESIKKDEFEESIEEQAKKLRADWVVYGYLNHNSKDLTLKVYLNAYRMPNARDLTGHYAVLTPNTKESIETNQAAYKEMLSQIAEQSESLANFGLGLGYFSMDQIEKSQEYFDLAEDKTLDLELLKVIYLFQSKTRLVNDDYEGARAYLEKALEPDAYYSRALLGLGHLDYLSARTSQVCSNPILTHMSGQADTQGTALDYQPLEDALQLFEVARMADGKDPEEEANLPPELIKLSKGKDYPSEPEALIPIKADYYTGRVYHCMSSAGLEDRWIDAQCSFWSVIFFARLEQDWLPDYCNLPQIYWDYRKREEDELSKSSVSRNLAANAFTDLAVLNWEIAWNLELQGDMEEAKIYYARIEDYFKEAIKISEHDDEQALNHVWLADYYTIHKRCDDAKEHLQRASDEYFNGYLKDNPNLHREDFEEFYTEVQSRDDCG